MINILKKLLDLIYEKKCYFCSKSSENTIFCSKCFNSISFLAKNPVFSIENVKIYSATKYSGVVQKLIRAVKYHNKKELAYYQAKLMYDFWIKNNNHEKEYIVIPVPMFYSKARKRKYNHMDLVGEEFCKLTKYQLDTKSLIRNRETKPQYNLSKSQREENLKDAFSLTKTNFDKPILLIDDITTTGTTLKEIIKEFHKNNITDITAFVTSNP